MHHLTGDALIQYLMLAMKQGYYCWAEYSHHAYQFFCGVAPQHRYHK